MKPLVQMFAPLRQRKSAGTKTRLLTAMLSGVFLAFAVGPVEAANKSKVSTYQHGKPVGSLPCELNPGSLPRTNPLFSRTAVLMGGGVNVKEALSWMITKMALCADGSTGTPGNFVVIRAGGNPEYDSFIAKLGTVASVVTLVVPSRETAMDPENVPIFATYIQNAGAIWLTGGDQGDYYTYWKGTPLESLISEQVRNFGIPDVRSELGLAQGEAKMFVLDAPDVSPQYAQVMVADASQAQLAAVGKVKKLGVCHLVPMIEDAPPPAREAGAYVFGLDAAAFVYLYDYEHREVRGTTTVKVLQKPEHGVLEDNGGGSYSYYPNAGYLGKDKAIFEVQYAGEKLHIVYFFRSIDGGTDGMEEKYCPKGTRFWKISSTSTTPTLDNAALQALLDATGISNSVTVNTGDLSGGAIGQTTGSSITLDTNAAGYGWFIDYTPYLNDEYLPTSNPNLWVAKAGTEAAE